MRALRLFVLPALLGALLVLSPRPVHAGAAADFTLRDINGASQSLSSYKGKVVLVNFWATWCGPCQVEMPHLEALFRELGPKGLVVLGISTDDAKLDASVKPMVKSKGLTYPILRDPQTTVVSQYNPTKTLPFNVVIDRGGQIVKVHSGYNPGDEKTLRAELEELLAKAP